MLLMIDNYDSFTYNLVQYLMELGSDVRVGGRGKDPALAQVEVGPVVGGRRRLAGREEDQLGAADIPRLQPAVVNEGEQPPVIPNPRNAQFIRGATVKRQKTQSITDMDGFATREYRRPGVGDRLCRGARFPRTAGQGLYSPVQPALLCLLTLWQADMPIQARCISAPVWFRRAIGVGRVPIPT